MSLPTSASSSPVYTPIPSPEPSPPSSGATTPRRVSVSEEIPLHVPPPTPEEGAIATTGEVVQAMQQASLDEPQAASNNILTQAVARIVSSRLITNMTNVVQGSGELASELSGLASSFIETELGINAELEICHGYLPENLWEGEASEVDLARATAQSPQEFLEHLELGSALLQSAGSAVQTQVTGLLEQAERLRATSHQIRRFLEMAIEHADQFELNTTNLRAASEALNQVSQATAIGLEPATVPEEEQVQGAEAMPQAATKESLEADIMQAMRDAKALEGVLITTAKTTNSLQMGADRLFNNFRAGLDNFPQDFDYELFTILMSDLAWAAGDTTRLVAESETLATILQGATSGMTSSMQAALEAQQRYMSLLEAEPIAAEAAPQEDVADEAELDPDSESWQDDEADPVPERRPTRRIRQRAPTAEDAEPRRQRRTRRRRPRPSPEGRPAGAYSIGAYQMRGSGSPDSSPARGRYIARPSSDSESD